VGDSREFAGKPTSPSQRYALGPSPKGGEGIETRPALSQQGGLQGRRGCAIPAANNPKRRKAMEEYAMSERTLIPISAQPKIGKIDEAGYFRLYEKSLADPDAFWGEHGKRLDWIKPYTKICNASDPLVRGRDPQRLRQLH
jgi:hypothetical protein